MWYEAVHVLIFQLMNNIYSIHETRQCLHHLGRGEFKLFKLNALKIKEKPSQYGGRFVELR